jgi:hypothetical protein
MTARTNRDTEWAARRAEGIINLALEFTVGAAIGGGVGIAIGLFVPSLVAVPPLVGTVGGITVGVVLGRLLLGGAGQATAS